MLSDMDTETIQQKYAALAPLLNERTRRLWAATEARALGHGGIACVERATGISRSTIVRGLAPSLPRLILLAKSISSSRTGWHGSCQVAISHA
jgi:hypothetical protein